MLHLLARIFLSLLYTIPLTISAAELKNSGVVESFRKEFKQAQKALEDADYQKAYDLFDLSTLSTNQIIAKNAQGYIEYINGVLKQLKANDFQGAVSHYQKAYQKGNIPAAIMLARLSYARMLPDSSGKHIDVTVHDAHTFLRNALAKSSVNYYKVQIAQILYDIATKNKHVPSAELLLNSELDYSADDYLEILTTIIKARPSHVSFPNWFDQNSIDEKLRLFESRFFNGPKKGKKDTETSLYNCIDTVTSTADRAALTRYANLLYAHVCQELSPEKAQTWYERVNAIYKKVITLSIDEASKSKAVVEKSSLQSFSRIWDIEINARHGKSQTIPHELFALLPQSEQLAFASSKTIDAATLEFFKKRSVAAQADASTAAYFLVHQGTLLPEYERNFTKWYELAQQNYKSYDPKITQGLSERAASKDVKAAQVWLTSKRHNCSASEYVNALTTVIKSCPSNMSFETWFDQNSMAEHLRHFELRFFNTPKKAQKNNKAQKNGLERVALTEYADLVYTHLCSKLTAENAKKWYGRVASIYKIIASCEEIDSSISQSTVDIEIFRRLWDIQVAGKDGNRPVIPHEFFARLAQQDQLEFAQAQPMNSDVLKILGERIASGQKDAPTAAYFLLLKAMSLPADPTDEFSINLAQKYNDQCAAWYACARQKYKGAYEEIVKTKIEIKKLSDNYPLEIEKTKRMLQYKSAVVACQKLADQKRLPSEFVNTIINAYSSSQLMLDSSDDSLMNDILKLAIDSGLAREAVEFWCAKIKHVKSSDTQFYPRIALFFSQAKEWEALIKRKVPEGSEQSILLMRLYLAPLRLSRESSVWKVFMDASIAYAKKLVSPLTDYEAHQREDCGRMAIQLAVRLQASGDMEGALKYFEESINLGIIAGKWLWGDSVLRMMRAGTRTDIISPKEITLALSRMREYVDEEVPEQQRFVYDSEGKVILTHHETRLGAALDLATLFGNTLQIEVDGKMLTIRERNPELFKKYLGIAADLAKDLTPMYAFRVHISIVDAIFKSKDIGQEEQKLARAHCVLAGNLLRSNSDDLKYIITRYPLKALYSDPVLPFIAAQVREIMKNDPELWLSPDKALITLFAHISNDERYAAELQQHGDQFTAISARDSLAALGDYHMQLLLLEKCVDKDDYTWLIPQLCAAYKNGDPHCKNSIGKAFWFKSALGDPAFFLPILVVSLQYDEVPLSLIMSQIARLNPLIWQANPPVAKFDLPIEHVRSVYEKLRTYKHEDTEKDEYLVQRNLHMGKIMEYIEKSYTINQDTHADLCDAAVPVRDIV